MKFFDVLGARLLDSWLAHDFDERIFHELAVAELRTTPPNQHVSVDEIIDWVVTAKRLPPQQDVAAKFGQPPITVYRNERFHIDVIFWVDGTTSIHQHGFSGAFHVLAGSSLQSEYEFVVEHRYSDRLMTGRLDLRGVEHLRAGDVRAIRAGSGLIHSLFHLDRPAVSVVARTFSDPCAGPQYDYRRHGLVVDPFFTTDLVARQSQVLSLLNTLRHPNLREYARKAIEEADAHRIVVLLSLLATVMESDEYLTFLDELRCGHPELVQCLRRQRDETAREAAIVRRRQRIHSTEHRFFLALLLNVPSRERIIGLVRNAYPGARPEETICRWVRELAETRLEDGKNALDVSFDEAGLRILGHLIEGATDEQVLGRLQEEYEDVDGQRDQVLGVCRAIRESFVFRYLMLP